MKIFISYRRTGDLGLVGRLTDWLGQRFGPENVFRDISQLRIGERFEDRLQTELSKSDIVVAAIGQGWLGWRRFRAPRLRQEGDWVRRELEHAMELGIPVLPVLIEEAALPDAQDLPPALRGLRDIHVTRLRDASWAADFDGLAAAMERITGPVDSTSDETRIVWQKPEKIEEPRRSLFTLLAVATVALAVAVGGWLIFAPDPAGGPDLDDPSTWTAVPGAGRSDVADLALRLALLEMQAATAEATDPNSGFNVDKFTDRYAYGAVPWSVAFVTWTYLEALKRLRNDAEAVLPFRDTPSASQLAASLQQEGWFEPTVTAETLRPGDMIFLLRQDRIGHAEIVFMADQGQVCSVGGNVRDRVAGSCRDLPDAKFAGHSTVPPDAFTDTPPIEE